jgi:DNA-directed RNA polymerase subunit RPC12/RpoP
MENNEKLTEKQWAKRLKKDASKEGKQLTRAEYERKVKFREAKAKFMEFGQNYRNATIGGMIGTSRQTSPSCSNCGSQLSISGSHYRCTHCGRHIVVRNGARHMIYEGRR